jgi:hypothetical protein
MPAQHGAARRLGDRRRPGARRQTLQHLPGVVAFVRNHLDLVAGPRRQRECFELGRGDLERRFERLSVAGIAGMDRCREDRAAVQIDRALGLVGLYASRVRPSFSRVIRASGSTGLTQSAFETRLPGRAIELAELVRGRHAIPLVRASSPSIPCEPAPSSRRTIERIAATHRG